MGIRREDVEEALYKINVSIRLPHWRSGTLEGKLREREVSLVVFNAPPDQMSSQSASLQEFRRVGSSARPSHCCRTSAFVAQSGLLTLSVICDKFGSAVCLNLGHSSPAGSYSIPAVAFGGSPFLKKRDEK